VPSALPIVVGLDSGGTAITTGGGLLVGVAGVAVGVAVDFGFGADVGAGGGGMYGLGVDRVTD